MQQEREKKRQAVVFVSSFHPRGGVFCCSWRDGAFFSFFEAGRGGCFFFRGGTGRLLFFSEAGRGGFFFFFDGTGRGGVFIFFRGPGRDGCFWRWHFFWRDGAKSLHRPAKGGLNRPASRPCKALDFFPLTGGCSEGLGAFWFFFKKSLARQRPDCAVMCTNNTSITINICPMPQVCVLSVRIRITINGGSIGPWMILR